MKIRAKAVCFVRPPGARTQIRARRALNAVDLTRAGGALSPGRANALNGSEPSELDKGQLSFVDPCYEVSRMTDVLTGFYRRPLPETMIPFSSPEGRMLFREALATGGMEGWFALAEQFHTQPEPAFCGLGTLVVVLNALEIDPGRIWKGSWRWFGEELLDCCLPLERIRSRGVTIEELACLARCNGAAAKVTRAESLREQLVMLGHWAAPEPCCLPAGGYD